MSQIEAKPLAGILELSKSITYNQLIFSGESDNVPATLILPLLHSLNHWAHREGFMLMNSTIQQLFTALIYSLATSELQPLPNALQTSSTHVALADGRVVPVSEVPKNVKVLTLRALKRMIA